MSFYTHGKQVDSKPTVAGLAAGVTYLSSLCFIIAAPAAAPAAAVVTSGIIVFGAPVVAFTGLVVAGTSLLLGRRV